MANQSEHLLFIIDVIRSCRDNESLRQSINMIETYYKRFGCKSTTDILWMVYTNQAALYGLRKEKPVIYNAPVHQPKSNGLLKFFTRK